MKNNSFDKHVLSIVCSVFDAHSAVLFLPGNKEEECDLAASHSLGGKVCSQLSVPYGKGLVGWILRNHQPLLVPNFDQRQSRLGYYEGGEESKIKAFMGCPVPSGGALCVDSTRQYSFTDKDHKILQLFAELVIMSRQTSPQEGPVGDIPRYFAALGVIQDMRFSYRRWPVFLHNFLRAVAEAAAFEYCAFATVDPDGEFYAIEGESARLLRDGKNEAVFPIGSGITGWVLRNEQPVFSEGASAGMPTATIFGKQPDIPEFQSIICMPVMINRSVRGAVCLANTTPKEMDEPLRGFVRQAVDYMAMFLESLYLKNRMRGFMEKAVVHTHGPTRYDPDTAPMPKIEEE